MWPPLALVYPLAPDLGLCMEVILRKKKKKITRVPFKETPVLLQCIYESQLKGYF